jgi:hypothetical protein
LKSQFVLSGNVRDLQATEVALGTVASQSFNLTVADTLRHAGYAHILLYDPISGFQAVTAPGAAAQQSEDVLQTLGLTVANGRAAASIDLLGATLERLVGYQQEPIALIIDFASRLVARPETLSPAEHQMFTRALVLSHQTRVRPAGEQRKPFYNTVLWVVEKEGDLPDWLLVDNPRIRHIPVAKPDNVARCAIAPEDVLVYSGYAIERLRETLALASGLIDALISDPFELSVSQTLALRGSDNQRLHLLTDRGRRRLGVYDRPLVDADHSLDVMFDDSGTVWLAGIPRRGDMLRLRQLLSEQGHYIVTTDATRRTPGH